MTTILGIKTNSGPESIVLASDTQHNIDYGDYERKAAGGKIRIGENHAAAFTGNSDKYVERFSSYISGRISAKSFIKEIFKDKIHPNFLELPKDPIQAAIQSGFFPELGLINSAYYRSRDDESDGKVVFDCFTEFILSVNKPNLGLYHVDLCGNLSSPSSGIEYVTAGSGSEIVRAYLNENEFNDDPSIIEEIREDRITTSVSLELAICALKKAKKKDKDTGGPIDIVVLTRDSIEAHWQGIRRDLDKAENGIYQKIVDKYKVKSSESGT